MALYGNPAPEGADRFTVRRRTGVGGSDTGAILGVSPWSSRLGVWQDKRGLRDPSPASERMLWGNRLQDAVVAGYAEDHGMEVRRGTFRRHPTYGFIIGHPDAIATPRSGPPNPAKRLVEVKLAARMDEKWGEPGSADVPPHYYSQVQHYLVLTGYSVGELVALIGGAELVRYVIPADPDFQTALIEEEASFWREVREGIPPDPDGTEDAGRALRAMFPTPAGTSIPATPEVARYLDRLSEAQEVAEQAAQEAEKWKQLVMAYMGHNERLIAPGWSVSWSARRGSPSWKSIAEEARLTLALIAGPGDGTAEQLRAAARDTVEGWDALTEKYRGAPSRTFTASRAKPKGASGGEG